METFKTANPMLPFLEEAIIDIGYTLMKMIVKPEILDKANTSFKFINLDLSNYKKLLPDEAIKLPPSPKELYKSTDLPNNKKKKFTKYCKSMLVAFL